VNIGKQATQAKDEILAYRILNLEVELAKTKRIVEMLTHTLATKGGVSTQGNGGGLEIKTKFASLREQGDAYLNLVLTKEQRKIVAGNKRDEQSFSLRGKVICDLYERGAYASEIALILRKNPSTIHYHLACANIVKPKNNKQFYCKRASSSLRRAHAHTPQRFKA